MSDRAILQRYIQTRDERPGVAQPQSEADAPEDLGGFGWLRGIRDRAIMLELRKKDGSIMAVGYGYVERAEYCPSEGITLHVVGGQIRIKGRNLNSEVRPTVRLYEGLTRHRVSWIQEADRTASLQANDDQTIIDSIAW